MITHTREPTTVYRRFQEEPGLRGSICSRARL